MSIDTYKLSGLAHWHALIMDELARADMERKRIILAGATGNPYWMSADERSDEEVNATYTEDTYGDAPDFDVDALDSLLENSGYQDGLRTAAALLRDVS